MTRFNLGRIVMHVIRSPCSIICLCAGYRSTTCSIDWDVYYLEAGMNLRCVNKVIKSSYSFDIRII